MAVLMSVPGFASDLTVYDDFSYGDGAVNGSLWSTSIPSSTTLEVSSNTVRIFSSVGGFPTTKSISMTSTSTVSNGFFVRGSQSNDSVSHATNIVVYIGATQVASLSCEDGSSVVDPWFVMGFKRDNGNWVIGYGRPTVLVAGSFTHDTNTVATDGTLKIEFNVNDGTGTSDTCYVDDVYMW